MPIKQGRIYQRICLTHLDAKGKAIGCDFWGEDQAEKYELHVLMWDVMAKGTARFDVVFPYVAGMLTRSQS